MGGSFSFSILSVPFIVLIVGLTVLVMSVALIRGVRMIRISILAISLGALPWAVGNALVGSCTDPVLAAAIIRFWVGTISLLGPAFMMLILVYSGRLDRHATLLAISATTATATCVLTWTTDLVIADAWQTSWGFWAPKAGPLNDLQPGQLVLWSIAGIVLSRRGRDRSLETEHQQLQIKRMLVICVFAILGASDGLLAHGVGTYPFSFVPGVFAVSFALIAVFKDDVLHARGFDRVAAWELGVTAAFVALIVAILWLMARAGAVDPVLTAVVVAPLFGIGQICVLIVRRRAAGGDVEVSSDTDRAIEQYIEDSAHFDDEQQLVGELEAVLVSHSRLSKVRVFGAGGDGRWYSIGAEATGEQVEVDARVRAWLSANRAPIQRAELPQQRLGGLRAPIEQFFAAVDAQIIVSLVDRDRLVGAVFANAPEGGRGLSDSERVLVQSAAAATANALTYLRLVREAEARVEVAKEVEVAAAAQNARSPGETRVRYSRCEVITHYEPAAQFGGDWWASAELPDGRVLVAIGDVTGHGVPAALISSTVAGACETARQWWGGGLDALAMLQLLNEAVLDVGGDQYAMSCFVAVFDTDGGEVTFANAGHPFPYVCRKADDANGKAVLSSLVSRGTVLGTRDPVLSTRTAKIAPDDVVVFYSDALVESRDADGQPYGDRRFQRLLRNYVRSAGERACEVIVEDARGHYGGEPIVDDVTLVVVRLGH